MARMADNNIASLIVSFDSKSGEHLQMYDDLFDVLTCKKASVAEYTVIQLLQQYLLQIFLLDSTSLKEFLFRIFFYKLTRKHLISIVNTCRYSHLYSYILLYTGKLFSLQQISGTDCRNNIELVYKKTTYTITNLNNAIVQKLWIFKYHSRAIKYINRLQSIILVYYALNVQRVLNVLLNLAAKMLFDKYSLLI